MNPKIKNRLSQRFQQLEKKLPLEKFIPASLLVFLLCVFILSLITYQNIEKYKEDLKMINHSNDVLKKIEHVNYDLIQIPFLRRGYAITADQSYVTKLDSLSESLKNEIHIIQEMVSDNREQEIKIVLLDSVSSEIISSVKNSLTDSLSDSLFKQNESEISNKKTDITNSIQKNIQEAKDITENFIKKEVSILNNRSFQAEETNSTIQKFIIVTGLFSFVVIGLSLLISGKLIKNKSIAEDLLLKSFEELEEIVDERTQELKETNEFLRESEQRFRVMADSAPVLIWISGKDKHYTYFNKKWLSYTGRTMIQELGEGWMSGIHPDDLKKCTEIYNTAFDERISFEMEYRLKNAEGEYLWLLANGTPRYEGKEFAGYTGSCIEINERKKNERFLKIQYDISKTLAESETLEEALNRILENICNGINWNFGLLWLIDEKSKAIKPGYLWSDNKSDLKKYTRSQKDITEYSVNDGIRGRVLKEGRSVWSKDISIDKWFGKNELYSAIGWKSGMGIPISNGKNTIAIIECLNKKNIEEQQELFDVLESAGRQIGNFMERKRVEEILKISYQDLEEKVNLRTQELANTLSDLIRENKEKELIQNRIKLFAHAIRSIKDFVFITDLDYKTIFVNEAFESAYGYSFEELSGKEIPVLSDKYLTQNLRKDILKKNNSGWKGELTTYRKDGSGFYTYLSVSFVRNEIGNTEAVVGICQDISDLKNAQETLKKRNNLLTLLNSVIRFTNQSFDLNEAILFSINKVCEYTNFDLGHYFLIKNDDLVSSGIWNDNFDNKFISFKNISDRPELLKTWDIPGKALDYGVAAWLDLETQTDEHFIRSQFAKETGLKTGIWVPVKINKRNIGILEFFKKEKEQPDRELLDCIYNIGLEIGRHCEKLEAIHKIKMSEKTLMDAQHIAKLGSWKWDIQNDSITWSDEMYQIYELDINENINYEKYLSFMHPEDIEKAKTIVKNAIENKSSFDYFHRIITPSGNVKTLNAQGEIHYDENGILTGMFGTGHDVTEIRQVEEELRRTNLILVETQKELIFNEKLAALGRFSSGIAHEIRNPLANISSLTQLVAKADLDDKNKRRLNYIITNVDIANKIIKNLLSYASPEDLDFSYKNIREILNSIFESAEARCRENNITIIKEIPEDLPLLYLDELRLESSFMNFVSNSIDSMYDGGTLTVKVNFDRQMNVIKVDIIDTGIGIPPENIDKILEPFFTTKDDGVGLGMGLAYQTIKLHQGDFKIYSTLGKGTHIKITLPVRKIKI